MWWFMKWWFRNGSVATDPAMKTQNPISIKPPLIEREREGDSEGREGDRQGGRGREREMRRDAKNGGAPRYIIQDKIVCYLL